MFTILEALLELVLEWRPKEGLAKPFLYGLAALLFVVAGALTVLTVTSNALLGTEATMTLRVTWIALLILLFVASGGVLALARKAVDE